MLPSVAKLAACESNKRREISATTPSSEVLGRKPLQSTALGSLPQLQCRNCTLWNYWTQSPKSAWMVQPQSSRFAGPGKSRNGEASFEQLAVR